MLIVVLPAFNEEDALGPLLESLYRLFSMHFPGGRVVVVDDGSTDGTERVARSFDEIPVEVLKHDQNKGLSETIKTGLLHAIDTAADDDIVVTLDADNTHNPGSIFRMALLIEEGNDVVIASRYAPGARVIGLPRRRQLYSLIASWLFRLLFPIPGVKDYTCGYRAFRAKLLQQALEVWGEDFVSAPGFACMVDILLRLRTMGAIMTEVPLILRYDLKPGASKMNVGRTIKDTLRLTWRRKMDPSDRNAWTSAKTNAKS